MARMIPPEPREDTESEAESLLFHRLAANLPNDYTVWQGVQWSLADDGLSDFEADFVVAHPERGALVVEVKGGLISCEDESQRWYSEDLYGRRHPIKDPFRQARRTMYALRDLLHSQPRTRGHAYWVTRAVAFPDSAVGTNDFPTMPRDAIIDRHDLHSLRRAVERAWGQESPTGPGKEGIAALAAVLGGARTAGLPERIAVEHAELQRLTSEQATLLDVLAGHRRVAIEGVAGSGKTMLALEQCRRLARDGARVLFTCFNKPLAAFARQTLLRELGPHATVMAMNYHDLAADYARRAGVPLDIDRPYGDDQQQFWQDEVPQRFQDAIEGLPQDRFDAVVVDEAQDFTDTWWVTLESLLRDPAHDRFFVFYDENQRIFPMRGDYPIPQPHFRLTRNCRNTRRIHSAVAAFDRGTLHPTCPGPEGRAPVEIAVTPESESHSLQRVLHDLVVGERVPLGDIVVLSLSMSRKSRLPEGQKLGNFTLSWKADGPGVVRCRSIYSFKGLESPVVVVVELDRADPAIRSALLYTALSRAQHHLVVLGTLQRE